MLPEIITGGSNLLGSAIDAVSGAIQNKRMRQYNDQVYTRQRNDSLADWRMMNEYNHPSAQMARLREAGLNPNLVYGSGAAQAPAQMVKSTDSKPWQPRPINVGQGMGEAVGRYFDTRIQQAQYNNLRAQNTVLLNKAMLQTLEKAQVAARTAYTETQRTNALRLADASIAATETNVMKMKNDMLLANRESDRRDARLELDAGLAAATIARQKAETELTGPRKQEILARVANLKSNTEYRDMMNTFEKKLADLGMTKNDELWQRLIAMAGNGIVEGLSLSKIFSQLWEAIKNGLTPW